MSQMVKPPLGTPLRRDDPFAADLVACWLFNDQSGPMVTDATGNGNNGTMSGVSDPATATSGWCAGPDGAALMVDGVNDYIKFDTSQRLDFGTGDFTIKCAMKITASAPDGFIIGFRNYNSGGGLCVALGSSGTNGFVLVYGGSGGTITGTSRVDDGAFHDISIVRKAGSITLNVDGKTEATGTAANDFVFQSLRPVIGVNDYNEGGSYMPAVYTYFFIYKRALSDAEIAFHNAYPYTAFEDFQFPMLAVPARPPYDTSQEGTVKPTQGTPLNRAHPSARDLAGCWLFNERGGAVAYDSSGNGNDAAIIYCDDPGTSASGWGAGLAGGALYLDGANDFARVGSNGRMHFRTGDFSVLVKLKMSGVMSDKFIVGFRPMGAGGLILGTGAGGNSGKLRCGGTSGGDLNSTTSIDDGEWHDCAFIRKNGVITLNVDGKTEATGTDTTDWSFADNRPVFGVNDFTEGGNYIGGAFSTIFIYRRALSDDDVTLHNAFPYAMFDAGELPLWAPPAPPEPPPYLTSQPGIIKPQLGTALNRDHPLARGMVGCWLFNEGTGLYVWDATGRGKNGTLVGMANPATAASGWNAGLHGGALAFDGGDDAITAISPGLYSNYSICAQFRLASQATTFQGLVAWGAEVASQRRSLSLWNGGAGALKLVSSTYASNILGATSLVDGVDYFGVITVEAAGVANVYLNGTLDGTGTNTLAAMGADAFSIGNIGLGSFFNGSMSLAFIYDRALSADEVAELYSFPYAMFEPPGPPYILAAPPQSLYNRSQGMFALLH